MVEAESPGKVASYWKPVVVGALAGLISGLFGVGGGILVVPGLVMVAGMPQRLAHGTSLAAVVPIGASGALGYAIAGEIDYRAVLWLAVGAAVGAVVGTAALKRAGQGTLRLAFALLLLVTAVRMVMDAGSASGRDPITVATAAGFVAIGVAAGVLSGMFGIGGGVVMVPAMIVLLSMPDVLAKGTSLLVIVPTSIVGTWRNVRHGNADLKAAGVVGAAGVVTALVGARISLGLSSHASAILFAVLLAALAVRLLVTHVRERRLVT